MGKCLAAIIAGFVSVFALALACFFCGLLIGAFDRSFGSGSLELWKAGSETAELGVLLLGGPIALIAVVYTWLRGFDSWQQRRVPKIRYGLRALLFSVALLAMFLATFFKLVLGFLHR